MIDIITQGKLPEVNVEPVQVFVHFMHNVLSSESDRLTTPAMWAATCLLAMTGWTLVHFIS